MIRLCRRLDGLPLAIELAAIRLRALPVAELASRLDQRLALLASGHGARHRTLRDAIGWSHDLCTPAEKALWACLSVFGGPFTRSAAEEVCSGDLDPGQVMPTLIRLVDKSILMRAGQAASAVGPSEAPSWSGAGQPTRYLMLGTFRAFGAGQLAPPPGRRGGGPAGGSSAALPGSHGRRPGRTTYSTTTSSAGCANCGVSTTTSGPRSILRARRPGQPRPPWPRDHRSYRGARPRSSSPRRPTGSSSPPPCSTTGVAMASPTRAASGSARPSRGRPAYSAPAPARCSRARPPARDAGPGRSRARGCVAGHRRGRRACRQRADRARPPGQDHGADHGGAAHRGGQGGR